jgi:uncharacterized membrane protein
LDNLKLLAIGLYVAVVVASVGLEHWKLAHRWRRRELERRAVGIGTVLGWAIPLWAFGVIDVNTWLILVFGFIAAGAMTGYLYTQKQADMEQEVDKRGEALRRGESGQQNAVFD